MIRICLVEDQTIVREGLLSLLRMVEDFEVVAQASDGEEAVRLISQCSPHVVLLDVKLPKLDGLQVLERIRERGKGPPTIILTTFDDDEIVLEAVAWEQWAFSSKTCRWSSSPAPSGRSTRAVP